VIWYGLNTWFLVYEFYSFNRKNNRPLDMFFYFGQLFSDGIEVGIGEVVLLGNIFSVCNDIITWVFVRGSIYSLIIMLHFKIS
jgi:hypothetical protein